MKTKINQFLKYSALVSSAVVAVSTAQASSDYGPAIWNPACNGHWYTSGYGHKFHVVHDMEGYYLSTISYFQNCNTQASVHYCVNGLKDTSTDHAAGEITQMVLEACYAWHVLCWNTYCTGTEHEGFVSNPAWYTEAMYQASAGISRHEGDKFGFAKDRNHIVGHNEWQNANWRSYASANFGINPNCNTHTDPGVYWDWNHYMALINPPSGGRNDVFWRNKNDNTLRQWTYANGIWNGEWNLGFALSSDPAATSWGVGSLMVFFQGTNFQCQEVWWTGSAWAGPYTFGGSMGGAPTATVGFAANRVDVFYRNKFDNTLRQWAYVNGVWNGEYNLGFICYSDPVAVSWGTGNINIYFEGSNGACQEVWWTGSNWAGPYVFGGTMGGGPGACSWAANRNDVFWRNGYDNSLRQWSYSGAWNGEFILGFSLYSDPAAVSWGTGNLNVYFQGPNNLCQEVWYTGSSWAGPISLGNSSPMAGKPAAVSWNHPD